MRVSIHEYYLRIADNISLRSTCPLKSIGALVVFEDVIRSTGYNGAARNLPHCQEAGCIIVHNHCERVVHAEANALLRAEHTRDATLYTTHLPCIRCAGLIINAGIKEVIYTYFYHDDRAKLFGVRSTAELLRNAGISVTQLTLEERVLKEEERTNFFAR